MEKELDPRSVPYAEWRDERDTWKRRQPIGDNPNCNHGWSREWRYHKPLNVCVYCKVSKPIDRKDLKKIEKFLTKRLSKLNCAEFNEKNNTEHISVYNRLETVRDLLRPKVVQLTLF
jgi:hypothetical protein